MSNELDQILLQLRELLPEIKKRFAVAEIRVFGSYARAENNKHSDLDLLVSFSKVPGLLKFLELENLLTAKLGLQVDLVMKDSVKSRLRKSIYNEAVEI